MALMAKPDGFPQPDEEADGKIEQLLHTLYYEAGATTSELLDYALGLTTAADARRIEQQLATNSIMRKELAELQALNLPITSTESSDAHTMTVAGQFLQWVQEHWPQRIPLLALPQAPVATMAVRGTDDHYDVYAVGPYRLALTISIADERLQDETYIVQGQLINQNNPDERCQGSVQLVPIAVADGNGADEESYVTAPETTIDEFGFFQLFLNTTGGYRFVAALSEHTIWIQELHVP